VPHQRALPTPSPSPQPLAEDAVLAARAADGDAEAFTTIYELYKDLLWNVAWLHLHQHAAAEDAVADTFHKAWKARHLLRKVQSLKAYLTRICVNCCHDVTRLRRNEREVPLDRVPKPSELSVDLPDIGLLPTLLEELSRLDRKQQEAFNLVVALGYSTTEAATALGVPERTVRWRVRKVKLSLAKIASADSDEPCPPNN
jgi:RNA polymerase sigma-70 factor (ECF subfamily)